MKIHQKSWLDKRQIEKLVLSLRSSGSANPALAEKIRTEADYFRNNIKRMRYPEFRAQHLFVGSLVIEAGCKTVVGSRLKQSGMLWTVKGANAILALRCSHLNGRFEDYWEAPRAARLPLSSRAPKRASRLTATYRASPIPASLPGSLNTNRADARGNWPGVLPPAMSTKANLRVIALSGDTRLRLPVQSDLTL